MKFDFSMAKVMEMLTKLEPSQIKATTEDFDGFCELEQRCQSSVRSLFDIEAIIRKIWKYLQSEIDLQHNHWIFFHSIFLV